MNKIYGPTHNQADEWKPSEDEESRAAPPPVHTGIPDPLTEEQHSPTWQHHIVQRRGGGWKKKQGLGLNGRGGGGFRGNKNTLKKEYYLVRSFSGVNFDIVR